MTSARPRQRDCAPHAGNGQPQAIGRSSAEPADQVRCRGGSHDHPIPSARATAPRAARALLAGASDRRGGSESVSDGPHREPAEEDRAARRCACSARRRRSTSIAAPPDRTSDQACARRRARRPRWCRRRARGRARPAKRIVVKGAEQVSGGGRRERTRRPASVEQPRSVSPIATTDHRDERATVGARALP